MKTLAKITLGALIAVAVLTLAAEAHVRLDSPNGGEAYAAGESIMVEWQILAGHQIEGWDLWYSTVSRQGPWTFIATAPSGDTADYAIHQYYWTAPDLESSNVYFRIRQNTTFGTQWADTSAYSFSITGDCCEGTTGDIDGYLANSPDIADLVHLTTFMFSGGPPPFCIYKADIDGSGSAVPDIADLVYLVSYMFSGGPPPALCSVS